MEKVSFLIEVEDGTKSGLGECSLIPLLSPESEVDVVDRLEILKQNPSEIVAFTHNHSSSERFPALVFALEMALLALEQEDHHLLLPSDFTLGKGTIPINGLVWMDDFRGLDLQVDRLVSEGFTAIKLKIDRAWDRHRSWLQHFRAKYPDLTLRVDANGAFSYEEARKVLDDLHRLKVHSIEQPIAPGQYEAMRDLCRNTPVPIALDEELISLQDYEAVVRYISPQFLILKPSLHGGFARCDRYAQTIERLGGSWWATSALESNVGLGAIAQWVFLKSNPLLQGLGTGSLFTENIHTPLFRKRSKIYWNPSLSTKKIIPKEII